MFLPLIILYRDEMLSWPSTAPLIPASAAPIGVAGHIFGLRFLFLILNGPRLSCARLVLLIFPLIFSFIGTLMRFHYTPTYSSWLNQVELWFAKYNGTSLPVSSSLPSLMWLANSAATSTPVQQTHNLSSGSTQILLAVSVVTNSLRQATR